MVASFNRFAWLFGCGLAFLLCVAPSGRSDETSALINQELDKQISIDVNDAMPEVMKKITAQTGVRIEVSPKVYELLPWGAATNIKATIRNQTLRQSLTALTRKLGLTWDLGREAVEVSPRLPLERLGRRATLAELKTLDLIDDTPLGANPPPAKPVSLQAVVNAVDQRLNDLKLPVVVEFRPGDKAKASEQMINLPRNATLNDALREVSKQTNLTWYPWGQTVVIVPKEVQVGRMLDRTLTRHYSNTDLAQILTELSQAADVPFEIQPGAIQRVPVEFRKLTLLLDNAKVREALEEIRGVTGLDYEPRNGAVYISSAPMAAPVAGPTTVPAAIIGTLHLDNGTDVFLRANDVPADILAYIEHKKAEEFARLREKMKAEHFVPTTQPAN